ncbi:Rik1-associated factor 1 [Cordyceps fumosorosea ARSEF 2679]|uniref:Rik1-associated factor 1 n=1 Tax=Cordyceps fumosorosea (strain ARSEF 2679) TaxID=1081104 RepID=A0A168CCI2_CORFA|nr:Rik1-associated factor 1 [Cordyceps fumosorosea ARSEF 2679]OAA71223.1 Rik1-associated factor 1 [Cordyceps fumosorosea ARSEF 2679]
MGSQDAGAVYSGAVPGVGGRGGGGDGGDRGGRGGSGRRSSNTSQTNGGGYARREPEMDGSDEEPPSKRLRFGASPLIRSSEETPHPRKERSLANLYSVLHPHIIIAIAPLSFDKFNRAEIAVQAGHILAKDAQFLSLLNGGEVARQRRTQEVVGQLCLLPQYHRNGGPRPKAPKLIKQEPTALPSTSMHGIPAAPTTVTGASRAPKHQTLPFAAPASLPNRFNRPLRNPYRPRAKRETSPRPPPQWAQSGQRPYLSWSERDAIQRGKRLEFFKAKSLSGEPAVYHVDFSTAEIATMIDEMKLYLQMAIPHTAIALRQLCDEYPVALLMEGKLPGRTEQDIRKFCSDLFADQATDSRGARTLLLQGESTPQRQEQQRDALVSSLLFARELEGNAGMGRTRRFVNFQASFKQIYEDGLSLAAEFTNCAGDISTMTWVPNQNIICGTTAHSDAHNQQYNKPGNLLLCSISKGVLRAFPDHRIPRPLVPKGENSTIAMRQSQDPWIYSSVVSSDYDNIHGLAYTSSFDWTIKAWKVDQDGSSMEAVATFKQNGNVNFVAVARDGSGRVAVAADANTEAVRIYTMDPTNMTESPYYTISCSRTDANGSDKWAYFPATVQWGIAPGTQHLLLVGYSPRSLTDDEQDIPDDKQQTGEILLWDARDRRLLPVLTATAANVFEVAWHPTVCGFVVGTSPVGLHIDQGVRTQVHVFGQDRIQHPDGAYSELNKLDCFASDINELTIVSNSRQSAYVTAACTDGNVYVWDMAQGDKPIHVLRHGGPLEGLLRAEDREREDTGVKFTAWGRDLTRLYTGSSDGVVKVWNVRKKSKPFVRDLLRAPAPISCGSFSPDRSKLAVGDATGRLFLFTVTKDEKLEEQFTMTLPGTGRVVRRPKPFTPHPEPPPPSAPALDPDVMALDNVDDEDEDVDEATYARRKYLDTQQVTIHANPVVGAVQGPRYAASGLFLREAHLDDDPAAPLLAKYDHLQQESRHSVLGAGGANCRRRSMRRLVAPTTEEQRLHADNLARDFDPAALDRDDLEDLVRAGALLHLADEAEDWGFEYEGSLLPDDDDCPSESESDIE